MTNSKLTMKNKKAELLLGWSETNEELLELRQQHRTLWIVSGVLLCLWVLK